MKKCTKCKEEKGLKEFTRDNSKKSGYSSWCKICKSNYRRSKNGLVSKIYNSQRVTSKKRKHLQPQYTKKELEDWMFKQKNFDELYKKWVYSGYEKLLSPSVDRLNDYKCYSFDNIRLVTWRENNKKSHLDRLGCINKKCCKAVIQCDLSGNEIQEFDSLSEAERKTGVKNSSISYCCRRKNYTAGGFTWKYKS